MNEKVVNSFYIKSIYTKTSNEVSPLNPDHNDPYNTYWKWLDDERIFYLIRIPKCNGGLYKLGVRGKGRQGGGGSRLREYFVSYGWTQPRSEGYTVLEVITFNQRKATQAGLPNSQHRWAEHEFEKRVKDDLRDLGISPERGNEYFNPRDYDKIVEVIEDNKAKWDFYSTRTRRSGRFDYEAPIPGDKITYNFDDGSSFDGIVRGQALSKKGRSWFEIDFRSDPKYVREYGGEVWDGFADRPLTKAAFDPEREKAYKEPKTWSFVKKARRPNKPAQKQIRERDRGAEAVERARQPIETSARAKRALERARRAERAINAVRQVLEDENELNDFAFDLQIPEPEPEPDPQPEPAKPSRQQAPRTYNLRRKRNRRRGGGRYNLRRNPKRRKLT